MKSVQLVAACLLAALAGCASVQPTTTGPAVQSESKHRFEKNYVIGEEKGAFVGEPIVKVKDYWESTSSANALAADRAATIPLPPFSSIPVPQGSAAIVVGSTQKKGKTYRVIKVDNASASALQFLLNDDGTLEGSAINFMGSKMGWGYTPTPPDLRYLPKTLMATDTKKGWRNFEIIYSGATKDSLNLLYREYTPDDMARPSFTQNLTYDRSSMSIRFRDIAIRVISADNQGLRYTVEQDGMKE